ARGMDAEGAGSPAQNSDRILRSSSVAAWRRKSVSKDGQWHSELKYALIQEIPLRHRQYLGRSAGEQLAVGTHLVGLGVDLDIRRRVVVVHALLRNITSA